jgi:hypothetical protein
MNTTKTAGLLAALAFSGALGGQSAPPAKSIAERLGYPANARLLVIHADAYKKMLAPLWPGSYQLIVHLAYNDDEMQGATADHPNWGAEWRQNDFDLVRSAEFQKFLKDQGFVLVAWRDLAKALPAQ